MPGAAHEENSQIYKVRVGQEVWNLKDIAQSLGGEEERDWDGVRRCRGESMQKPRGAELEKEGPGTRVKAVENENKDGDS